MTHGQNQATCHLEEANTAYFCQCGPGWDGVHCDEPFKYGKRVKSVAMGGLGF